MNNDLEYIRLIEALHVVGASTKTVELAMQQLKQNFRDMTVTLTPVLIISDRKKLIEDMEALDDI